MTGTPGPCPLPDSLVDKVSRSSFSFREAETWPPDPRDFRIRPLFPGAEGALGPSHNFQTAAPSHWTPLPPTHSYLLMHFNVEPVGHFVVLQRKSCLAMSTVPMDVQLLWVMLGLPTAPRLGGITAGPRASQLLGGPEGEPREESRNPLHSPQGSGGGGQYPDTLAPQRCP